MIALKDKAEQEVAIVGLGPIALGVAIVMVSAPIWRGGGHTRHDGVCYWEMLADTTQSQYKPFGSPHIEYDVAVMRAREAYRERC